MLHFFNASELSFQLKKNCTFTHNWQLLNLKKLGVTWHNCPTVETELLLFLTDNLLHYSTENNSSWIPVF